MQKIKNSLLFIIMITMFVGFALLSYVRKPLAYSTYEQRSLASFPALDTKLGTNLNAYANDQFIFRNQFMQIKSKLQLHLGQRNLNGIWVQDTMMFQEGVSLSSTQKDQLVESLQSFASKTKLKPKVMIIGDRINLLPELVTEDMNTIDSIKDIQTLQKALPKFNFIDVNSLLMNQSDAFYQSDHHYTTKGAKICFDEYHKKCLSKEEKYEYEVLPLTNQFQGTLANQSGIRNHYDLIELYFPKKCETSYLMKINDKVTSSVYDIEKGSSQNAYEVFFGGNHPLVELTTTAKNEKHLLVVKDSFANAFVPFLLPYYHRITMVDPRYYYDNIYQFIETESVNDVLFLYSSQTLFQDSSIIDFCQMEVK